MFTGIVREVATIAVVGGGDHGIVLEIDAPLTAPGIDVGGSVAINGVCLTAERVDGIRLTFHAVPETVSRTTLGTLERGSAVNLEPALRAGDSMGGHIVQGHVDGIGTVRSVDREGEGLRVVIEAIPETLRYCVEKGSITVEGVSLTVADLQDDALGIALIPHTVVATTLSAVVPGQRVNLEVDVLAKYVERLLPPLP